MSTDEQASAALSQPVNSPCYIVTFNVQKKHNIGQLLRSACAFGVHEVCLVGSRNFNTFGCQGTDVYLSYRHFSTLEECCAYLRQQGCQIIGVEITDDSVPVQQHPFCGPTAFMLGNEGTGLSSKQLHLCDAFVYIPQHGSGTASLNVTIAASIVLHHFATWAGYQERSRTGCKFDVADRPQKRAPRGATQLGIAALLGMISSFIRVSKVRHGSTGIVPPTSQDSPDALQQDALGHVDGAAAGSLFDD